MKTLYTDIRFVVLSQYIGTRLPWSSEPTPKILPVAGTKDFAMKTPAMQTLPKGIAKNELVSAIVKNFARIPGGREWYDNLGRALQNVYGSQTTPTAIPYDAIAQSLAAAGANTVAEMDEAIIRVALPVVVNQLAGRPVPKAVLDVSELGEDIYKKLATENLALGTEGLAKAVADVVPVLDRLRIGLNAGVVSDAIFKLIQQAKLTNTTPSADDLSRVLISEAAIAGAPETAKALVARQADQDPVQRRLAEAIARVGAFRGGPPPAWTGVVLPR